MAKKSYHIDGIGTVQVTKRRRSRRLRLRISSDGAVHVSIPYWVPYRSAVSFVTEKRSWITQHQPQRQLIENGCIIGKHHDVVVKRLDGADQPRTRVTNNSIVLRLPVGADALSAQAQAELARAAKRALVKQAQQILPVRVAELSRRYDFSYQSLRFRAMKSRWGSCSSNQDITLNVFLMQLDDDLIDYVILHELLHTRIPAHGKIFWSELERYVDDLAAKRKRMKSVEPALMPRLS